jgi:DNA-binding MarR family transcriptional regulator
MSLNNAFELNRLLGVIDAVLPLHPSMTLNQLQVLCLIAQRPGLTVFEIQEITGLPDSTASRIPALLGRYGNRGTEPLNLVDHREDLNDRRVKRLFLTASGQSLMRTIITSLIGGQHGGTSQR